MSTNQRRIRLSGKIRKSEPGHKRTGGAFNQQIEENRAVFLRYFAVDLFPGSLNIDVCEPSTLQCDLDEGKYRPEFVIPKSELVGMPEYIGDGQAWKAALEIQKPSSPVSCWVFRRIGSKVSPGVIEVLAAESLTQKYGLVHKDPVKLNLFG